MVKSMKAGGQRPTPEKLPPSAFAVYKSSGPEQRVQTESTALDAPSSSGLMKQISSRTSFPFRRSSRKKKKNLKKNIDAVQSGVVKQSTKLSVLPPSGAGASEKAGVFPFGKGYLRASLLEKKLSKQVNKPHIYRNRKAAADYKCSPKLKYRSSDRSVELSTSQSITGYEDETEEVMEEGPAVFDENLDPNSNKVSLKQESDVERTGNVDKSDHRVSNSTNKASKNHSKMTNSSQVEDSNIVQQISSHLTTSAPISVRKAVSKVSKMPFPVGNSEEDGRALFKWLIHPMSDEHFMSAIWEKKPALIRRRVPTYASGFFSTEDFNRILHECNVQYGVNLDVTSFQSGIRETHNPEGRVYPSVAWDYFKNGCSLRVKNPQAFSKPIWKLCATLQEYFKNMVGANIYLTPPGTQGFAPHYDDIEAFVLQLEGKKHWHLYNPRSSEETLPRFSSGNFTDDDIGEQIFDAILEPGDLLYFPRGFIHQAQAVPDTHSLHITISTYQKNTWADALEELIPKALHRAIERDVEFRKGLPTNFLSCMGFQNRNTANPAERKQILSKVGELFKKLAEHVDVDETADERARSFLHDALPPVFTQDEAARSIQGAAVQLCEPGRPSYCQCDINLNTNVRVVRKNALRLVKGEKCTEDEGAFFIYHCIQNPRTYHTEEQKYFAITADCIATVEYLIQSYPKFRPVSSMPLSSNEDKVNVICDLFEKGVLMTEDKVALTDHGGNANN